ncbi:MAG: hypothetical protein RR619_00110 [Raoultibacter sp.]
MRDTSGSSVLIALVFFLICAIIGSIVVTAASVNSKVTATYREAQQAEYVVTSATRALGDLVEGSQITWTYDEGSTKPSFGNEDSYKECATILKHVWITYGDAIWSARASGADYSVPEVFTLSIKDMKDTYARVVVDRDLNIELVLSLDEVQSTTSEYNETAYLQAEPSYDSSGKLLSLSWADARIVKTADDVSGDKS